METERVVKFHTVCPTNRVSTLRGGNQETVVGIRARTLARVSINPATGHSIVTLSAVETLANHSPASAAVFDVLLHCREYILGNYLVRLIVEEAQLNCVREDLLLSWGLQTSTSISVYQDNGVFYVRIVGGNHSIRNALQLIMGSLRTSYFH